MTVMRDQQTWPRMATRRGQVVTDAPSCKQGPSHSKRGKRRREQKLSKESTLAIIDRLLLAPVRINRNGKPAVITALEAIMYQLLRAEAAGEARASAVLLKYRELAKHDGEKRPQIMFAD